MARIAPGSPLWHKIMTLYAEGRTLMEIAKHPDIQKDHTTILYHVRKAGMPLNRGIRRSHKPKIVPGKYHYVLPKKPYTYKQREFGPGRCFSCGIKLKMAPDHNCTKGSYFIPPSDEMYGHSHD